jgi:hypothetical protein
LPRFLLFTGDKHGSNTNLLEETKTARGRKLIGRRGTIDTIEDPPVFLNVYSGHARLEFIEPIQRVFATYLANSSRKLFVFMDAVDLRSYDPEYRQQWVTWVDKHRGQIGGLHVHVRSKLVEMGINLARVALGPMMHAYSDRAEFERVYQQCKRESA